MNNNYLNLLDAVLEDLEKQSSLFKPTSFWKECSQMIIDEVQKKGFKDFRCHESTRYFFIPTYSFFGFIPKNESVSKAITNLQKSLADKRLGVKIERLFSGELQALSDYRTLVASNKNIPPFTDKISESDVGSPVEHFYFDKRYFSRSLLNYSLGINFLKQQVDTSCIKTIAEIGGGYGTLGELLLGDRRNKCFYINLDIPPTVIFSTYYLQTIFGKKNIADYEDLKDKKILDIVQLKSQYKAINTCSWHIEKLEGQIDLFVNFISFQEMEPDVVKNYCLHVERLQPKYILLRNMKEGKKKRDAQTPFGVDSPILAKDYDSFLPNYNMIAEDSSTFGFVTEDGFHSQLRLYLRK